MKHTTWRKHHQWIGLGISVFMILFSVSGILLNHRTLINGIDIDRRYLPADYRFEKWNNSLLRGTLRLHGDDSAHIAIYGTGGVFLTDERAEHFHAANRGFEQGADSRHIVGMAQCSDGSLFCAGQFDLYRLTQDGWRKTGPASEERFTDLQIKEDTLFLLSRSALYTAPAPYTRFTRHILPAPEDHDGRVTLFRTLWFLHSGELFGTAGQLFMDGVALLFIVITLSGTAFFLLRKYLTRAHPSDAFRRHAGRWLKYSLDWHDRLGRKCLVVLLFVVLTGWSLRPPLLLATAQTRIPPIPGTRLSQENPWHDKLRALRYDTLRHEWLLSTGEGFYTLASPDARPQTVKQAPPVSVMGVTVLAPADGKWLCGSFSGLYLWDRETGEITDYYTGQAAPRKAGPPFGAHPISGFSDDFATGHVIVEYRRGTELLPMPEAYAHLPMSLWNLALEIHTGRIYSFLGIVKFAFITFAGLLAAWAVWSGYKIRRKRTAKNNRKLHMEGKNEKKCR